MRILGVLCAFFTFGDCADTSLRWFLASPWIQSPLDSGGISLVTHIPIIPQRMDQPGIVSRYNNPGFRTPHAEELRGFAVPLVRLQIPLTEESHLSFSYTPQGMIRWSKQRSSAAYQEADSNSTAYANSHGTIYTSADADANWSVIQLSYSVAVSKLLDLSLLVERNAATLSAEGTTRGTAMVDWNTYGLESGFIEYSENDFHSHWLGQYEGSAWSAGVSTRIGRFLYSGQMGVILRMNGSFELSQRLPFFVDRVTMEPTSQNAEQWTAPENRDRLLAQETQEQNFSTSKPIHFRIPQSHRMGVVLLPWLHVDYTYWTGHFRTRVSPDSGNQQMDFRQYSAYDVNLNHLFLTHINTEWFLGELGTFWIHKRMEPVLSLGLRLPWKPVAWSFQLDALPWIRIFCGVAYAL